MTAIELLRQIACQTDPRWALQLARDAHEAAVAGSGPGAQPGTGDSASKEVAHERGLSLAPLQENLSSAEGPTSQGRPAAADNSGEIDLTPPAALAAKRREIEARRAG